MVKQKKPVSEGARQRNEFRGALQRFEKTLQERFVVPASVSMEYEKELSFEANEDGIGPDFVLVSVSRFAEERRERLSTASYRDQVSAADHFPKLVEALVKAQDAMNAQAHQASLFTDAQIRKLRPEGKK